MKLKGIFTALLAFGVVGINLYAYAYTGEPVESATDADTFNYYIEHIEGNFNNVGHSIIGNKYVVEINNSYEVPSAMEDIHYLFRKVSRYPLETVKEVEVRLTEELGYGAEGSKVTDLELYSIDKDTFNELDWNSMTQGEFENEMMEFYTF